MADDYLEAVDDLIIAARRLIEKTGSVSAESVRPLLQELHQLAVAMRAFDDDMERDRIRDLIVQRWHAGEYRPEVPLHEALGMTAEQYVAWVEGRQLITRT